MQKTSVSVVAYANSLPFVYGLLHSDVSEKFDVHIDIPAVCADKLIQNEVNISLVPVAEILRLNQPYIISDLCIGANDYVRTVLLAADCPLNQIKEIYLDYQSRTSVVLVKILASRLWKVQPVWKNAYPGYEKEVIQNQTGAVIIGDRTFSISAKFKFDLSHEWRKLTGLPFVFAAWLSKNELPETLKKDFNRALQFGIENLTRAVETYNKTPLTHDEICNYLRENIDFNLTSDKKNGLKLFLEFAGEYVL